MNGNSERETKYCGLVCENLSAMFDGELLTLPHSEINTHLNECLNCRQYQLDLPRLQKCLHDDSLTGCDVESLWSSVVEGIEGIERESQPIDIKEARKKQEQFVVQRTSSHKKARQWLSSLSIAVSVMFCVFGFAFLLSVPDKLHSAVVVEELVRDYQKFESEGGLFDKSESVSTNISWVASKVDFDLGDAIISPFGYQAAGVRLCSLLGKRIAFIHYEKDKEDDVSLYVMSGMKTDLPEGGPRLTGETPDGLTTLAWKEGDFGYLIISDLSVEEITSLLADS